MSMIARSPQLPTASACRTAAIRDLNDAFRRSFIDGHVVETPGVVELRDAERTALLMANRRFDQFDARNDPHGEHDFESIEIAGQSLFWKINPYDPDFVGHSIDPDITARALTVMLAHE